jgi:HlyD family secretion protein
MQQRTSTWAKAFRRVLEALAVVVALLGATGFGLWHLGGASHVDSPYRTDAAMRGDLQASFSATGTLEPEDVVDVGAQVAGQIKAFGVDARSGKPMDYGSQVEAGDLLAQIDDSLYRAKVLQSAACVTQHEAACQQALTKVDAATAAVKVADAVLQSDRANYDVACRNWERSRRIGLGAQSQQDYEAARGAFETARATVAKDEAALALAKVLVKDAQAAVDTTRAAADSARAQLAQDRINLGYTQIKAPVKGVIIDRRVTLGQTVQSSFNAPSLFLLARDLKKMKVWASVNEADIGQLHVGQAVAFSVDAFPGETFTGTVGLIRLNATMTNNVVTYTVEVLTDNPTDKEHPNGKLLPYLTANLTFVVSRRTNVLTVANEALRWKPDVKQVAGEARAAYQESLQRRSSARAGPEGREGAKGGPHHGTVWAAEGEYVRPVKLRLGLTDGARTEVLGGALEEGQAVVTGEAVLDGAGDSGSNPFTPKVYGNKKP